MKVGGLNHQCETQQSIEILQVEQSIFISFPLFFVSRCVGNILVFEVSAKEVFPGVTFMLLSGVKSCHYVQSSHLLGEDSCSQSV